MAESYIFQTTYAYAANNPISNIDVLGMAATSAQLETFKLAKSLGTTIYSSTDDENVGNCPDPYVVGSVLLSRYE